MPKHEFDCLGKLDRVLEAIINKDELSVLQQQGVAPKISETRITYDTLLAVVSLVLLIFLSSLHNLLVFELIKRHIQERYSQI